MKRFENIEQGTPRAPRFALQLPLQYRLRGMEKWSQGTTQNISRSGLLFYAEQPLEPNTALEISFVLKPDAGRVTLPHVVCYGEVVRRELYEWPEIRPAVAARILNYKFTRGGPSDA